MSTDSQLRPVARQSLENQVTDNLREYILSGAVLPGARLTEISLADRLGIARATLRTGLHRLVSEGVLVQIPYTGWEVVQMTPQDAWELWTLRGSLERLAASLAAQSTDPAVARGIQAAWDDLLRACKTSDMKKISERDYALHLAVVELSGHAKLLKQYCMLATQVRLFISSCNAHLAEGPQDIIDQHAPIVEAILQKDPARAGQEAWNHNEAEGQRLHDWLENRGPA